MYQCPVVYVYRTCCVMLIVMLSLSVTALRKPPLVCYAQERVLTGTVHCTLPSLQPILDSNYSPVKRPSARL